MSLPKALLVEDSPEFVVVGRQLLEAEGYAVEVSRDGLEAVAVARASQPELLLLDVTLPGLDGLEVCRRVREFSDAYIIMVTGRGAELDRVLGLAVGADDYVVKPYFSPEVAMRIRAMRRRPRGHRERQVRVFGSLAVDVDSREARLDDLLLDLTRTEFDLLSVLSGSPRRAFSRRQLLTAVWGSEWYGEDHLVDVHLANLRRKLGESKSTPRHLTTLRGVGYRFDP